WVFTQPNKTQPGPSAPLIVSGHIVDSGTKEALEGSFITLGGRAERTKTDEAGNFTIELNPTLPSNNIALFVAKPGYQPFDLHVTAGQYVDVDLIPLEKLKVIPNLPTPPKQPQPVSSEEEKNQTKVAHKVSPYDIGLKHFYWLYSFDPPGQQRRDWYQKSSSEWTEVYENGHNLHSKVVDAHANVEGN